MGDIRKHYFLHHLTRGQVMSIFVGSDEELESPKPVTGKSKTAANSRATWVA